ncbi:MAG: type II/IV secretion system protein [Candidatus Omnitrophica bacterium]|nr:type II/IV secretion system protein [Candidatus Omnitrophota bacterium]
MTQSLRSLYDELRMSRRGSEARAQSSDDPFILKLSSLLLSHGVELRASDIHIEPSATTAKVRYRIDGMLHEMLQIPRDVSEPLIRSIKVKANMATDVVGRSKPQDGRIDFEMTGRTLDMRLSSFPTIFGDVLAIRILDRSKPLLQLEDLGMPPGVLRELERVISRPNGLFLVTGPANSGKTTTLYAVLDKRRSPHVKIVTLEDPVEYQMEGINQAQINPQVGVTFASGLRAILRQDSNIILVGEIRDKETAEIGIRASLTGHLVLSTLHTRHAAASATRLIDMEIEPHLIVASVTAILAQRLVRVLCAKCKQPDPEATKTFLDLWKRESVFPPPPADQLFTSHSAGCASCTFTGYQGRCGVFELLTLHEELKQLILDRASSRLYKAAISAGMRTMLVDGLDKVAKGQTTIAEVLRVTGETEDL